MLKSDVIISGAGLSGGVLAIALAEYKFYPDVLEIGELNVREDQRVSAISYANSLFFSDIGIWQELEDYAEPILDIRVAENASHSFVHFDHKMTGDAPMGYMIENTRLKAVIYERLQELDRQNHIKLRTSCSYNKLDIDLYGAHLDLDNNQKITAPLLISCEGSRSCLRKMMRIEVVSRSYRQYCIICNINHEICHQGVAVEKFFPSGPLAVLPMYGGYRSAIVLTEPEFLAPTIMQMEEQEFITYLQQKVGDYLGDISLASQRKSHFVSLIYAKDYYKNRFLLVGDAAHSIHPVAGQGFNLTVRDIRVLLHILVEGRNLGLDIGSLGILKKFTQACKGSNRDMRIMTDYLIRLFGNDSASIKLLRNMGLCAVNSLAPLKRMIINRASG